MMRRSRLVLTAACVLFLAGSATAIAAFSKTASASQTISSRNLGASMRPSSAIWAATRYRWKA